jgi:peroxiredoxin
MRKLIFSALLLCCISAIAQDENLASKELSILEDSINTFYEDSINYYRSRYQSGDTSVIEPWDNLVDKYREARVHINKRIARKYPNTTTTAEFFHWFYYEVPYDTLIQLYENLGPIALGHKNGKHATGFVEREKKLLPGFTAPNFMQPDTAGNPVFLSDYKGKVILLEFWANWCKSCRAENPNIKMAYAKYREHGFDVLGISMDKETDKEKWLKAISEDGLPWVQVSDLKGYGNEAFLMYNVLPIPDNYLIDAEGKIIARGLRGQTLNDALRKIFGF